MIWFIVYLNKVFDDKPVTTYYYYELKQAQRSEIWIVTAVICATVSLGLSREYTQTCSNIGSILFFALCVYFGYGWIIAILTYPRVNIFLLKVIKKKVNLGVDTTAIRAFKDELVELGKRTKTKYERSSDRDNQSRRHHQSLDKQPPASAFKARMQEIFDERGQLLEDLAAGVGFRNEM